jgi:hypothetical protein
MLKRFHADIYLRISALFSEIETGVEMMSKTGAGMDGDLRSGMSIFNDEYVIPLLEDFDRLGLVVSRQWAEQIQRCIVGTIPLTPPHFAEMLKCLRGTLEKELNTQLIYLIPKERAGFIESQKPQFNDAVRKRFPLGTVEVERAGKAYALGLPNACVFHLMRAMEHCLKALGKSLKESSLDPRGNPSWDAILKRCNAELEKKDRKERTPEWNANEEFFNGATADLRAVKSAWRNPTMHVGRDYEDDEALDILNAVSGFIRHLAPKISE